MGYGGKISEQARARALRSEGWTLAAIASELGVARSSVSRWVRGVPFTPGPRVAARQRAPNVLQQARAAEIEHFRRQGRAELGALNDRELLVAGLALYAGEGAKADGDVIFTNTGPRLVRFFCAWLRRFFEVDEDRLRARLYLHEDLDLEAATAFWSTALAIPTAQFLRPHRPAVGATVRTHRHVHGCVSVRLRSRPVHRRMIGLIEALLSSHSVLPG
jgi:transcriptional regulator with XRE-family HTH domain